MKRNSAESFLIIAGRMLVTPSNRELLETWVRRTRAGADYPEILGSLPARVCKASPLVQNCMEPGLQ